MANYASNVEEYIEKIMTNILPESDLASYPVNSSGLVELNITNNNAIDLSIELPNSVQAGLYKHEKSSTTRKAILSIRQSFINPVYHSYYFRPFTGIIKSFDSLVAQSILELYPTPVQTYGAFDSSSTIYGGVIDLNHLQTVNQHLPVQTMRFDMFLNSLGFDKEINSFIQLQNFMKSPLVRDFLSERAIVQIALESYAIPNAVGEVDANSRNIIILFDPFTGKGEYACRIDAESNTYFNDRNNERSGLSKLPKGIFDKDELFESQFLKAINEKSSLIDWDLFIGLTNLASKLTTRNRIDEAICSGYKRNYFRVNYDQIRPASAAYNHFGSDTYRDFSEASIKRAIKYFNSVYTALKTTHFDLMPFDKLQASTPTMLEQTPLSEKGSPLSLAP